MQLEILKVHKRVSTAEVLWNGVSMGEVAVLLIDCSVT